MNLNMIKHLVLKDLSQAKYFILMYSVMGVLSACIALIASEVSFYVSMVLAITCLIGVGLHPMFVHVLIEKKDNNFPFVMSLPVSHMDYTLGKILTVYIFASIPWLCVVLTMTWVVLSSPLILDGFLGPALVIALEMFAAYSGALAIALVISNEAAMVVAIVVGNIGVNFFIMWLFRLEDVTAAANNTVFVWNPTLTSIVSIEILFMACVLGLTCFIQARKKDLI